MSHPDTKSCTKCGVEKDRSEFGKDKTKKDGLQHHCKNCRAAYTKANKEKIKAQKAAYYKANRERVKASGASYRKANHEKIKAYYAAWRKANPEKVKASNAAYHKDNPEKVNAKKAKRRAAKLKATPKWLTKRDFWLIEQFYEWSQYLDGPHHVDHIVPLQGKDVCGLHVPWNLQVLTAEENLKKSNKLEGGAYEQ